jgi:hypothetical protein
MWLERRFPGKSLSKKQEDAAPSRTVQDIKKTNLRNIVIKFLLDQSIGTWINTYAFIAAFAWFRGEDIISACSNKFWPMRIAALKVWPVVSPIHWSCVILRTSNEDMLAGISAELYGNPGPVSVAFRQYR